ncbi:Putative F-box/FBD/LRR-repeat protein At1g78760 [Linum grandiflorum]
MAAGGDDRISNLPDSIIHHILSFIDTTSAVRTSVLSKQWKSAWKHVHALNMELKFDEYSRYERFVDKLLSLRHSYHVSKVFCLPMVMNLVCSQGSSNIRFPMVLNILT